MQYSYFNFGSFGYVIGHELTHGFDDQGIGTDYYMYLTFDFVHSITMAMHTGQQFDRNGIRRQWWESSSIQAFRQRQTCFVEQYNNFTFEGVPVILLSVYNHVLCTLHAMTCTVNSLSLFPLG